MTRKTRLCPCGRAEILERCCGVYLSGERHAPTPEALMRSRYTAYSLQRIDYIERTMAGKAAERFTYEGAKAWAESVKWVKLEVLRTSADNLHGMVEFKAYYRQGSLKLCLHEKSLFLLQDGQWYYVDCL